MAEEVIIEKKTPPIFKVILAVLISAVVFGILGYMYGHSTPENESVDQLAATVTPSITESAASTVSADNSISSRYQSSDFGFSFALPSGYTVQEAQMFEGARGVALSFGKRKTADVSESMMVNLQYIANDNSSLAKLEENIRAKSGELLSDRKDLMIDGHPAFSYLEGGIASGKTIMTTNGNASVEISVYPDSNDTLAFIDSIAATFKF